MDIADDKTVRVAMFDMYLGDIPQRGERFVRVVSGMLADLIQNYALHGPWLVRASVEYTGGMKECWTPYGHVTIESVVGDAKCFEIREIPEKK